MPMNFSAPVPSPVMGGGAPCPLCGAVGGPHNPFAAGPPMTPGPPGMPPMAGGHGPAAPGGGPGEAALLQAIMAHHAAGGGRMSPPSPVKHGKPKPKGKPAAKKEAPAEDAQD